MSSICSLLCCPRFISVSQNKPKTLFPSHNLHPSSPIQPINKGILRLPQVAYVPFPPIDLNYMENEFSGHGVTFEPIGDSCVLRLQLERGGTASLMLPSGLITSYKALMWHGGKVELLHTVVSEAESHDADAVVRGGVSLAFQCMLENGVSWSPSSWALCDVRGSSEETIEVELVSRNTENMIEFKHIVTLQEDQLSSSVLVSNSNSSSLQLFGSVISHFTVSTPEATFAIGLEGSDFFSRPPVSSNFSLIPPNFRKKKNSSKSWDPQAFTGLFFNRDVRNSTGDNDPQDIVMQVDEDLDGEEEDSYKNLTEEMSRIYTSAPRNFTIIDRGKRNSVLVGRDGFNEVYILSPGSAHDWYGKYAYICVGQSALLQPLNLGPKGIWKGSQYLHNPNL